MSRGLHSTLRHEQIPSLTLSTIFTVCSPDLRCLHLTLWIHSLDRSQLHRGAHAVLVLGNDTEHVLLPLHDTNALAFGRGRFNGLPPRVHLGVPSFHDETRQVATTVVLRVIPVQEDHLAGDHNRLQVRDGSGNI